MFPGPVSVGFRKLIRKVLLFVVPLLVAEIGTSMTVWPAGGVPDKTAPFRVNHEAFAGMVAPNESAISFAVIV